MPDIKFAKLVVFVNCAVPGALLAWDAYHHRLGANPQEFALHTVVVPLHAWRMAAGSEGYWAGIVGKSRMAVPDRSSVDYVRDIA